MTSPTPAISEERVGEIEALARAATPGPWHAVTGSATWCLLATTGTTGDRVCHRVNRSPDSTLHTDSARADAEFIAACDPQTILSLIARLREASEDTGRLAKFGALVLSEGRDDLGSDVDGGWLQDTAEACGVLVKHLVTEPCDPETCHCADYGGSDFPMECYRYTPAVAAAIDAARNQEPDHAR